MWLCFQSFERLPIYLSNIQPLLPLLPESLFFEKNTYLYHHKVKVQAEDSAVAGKYKVLLAFSGKGTTQEQIEI